MVTGGLDGGALPPKSRLARELLVVVALKLAVIALAAVFLFGPDQRPRIDAATVAAHLLAPTAGPKPGAVLHPQLMPPQLPPPQTEDKR